MGSITRSGWGPSSCFQPGPVLTIVAIYGVMKIDLGLGGGEREREWKGRKQELEKAEEG